jgi:aryl-alcohol dehydrogenase-like predicted oxidoreductase
MRQKPLGRTGLTVSELCLGTMTWGNRNTEAEGHAQLDLARDHGVTFIDTAEMYPVLPVAAETVGRSEEILGTWFAKTGRRNEVVLATKISGAGQKAVRNGAPITPETLIRAVDASLGRLQTDVIDIYQLHWPNRGSYHFRQHWDYDPSGQNPEETLAHMEAILETAQVLIDQGKIRHFGLSNETAWGVMRWLRTAENNDLPRVATLQNEYSLLARLFDTDLAEVCVNEGIPLMAYSPLATGLLSGKYAGNVTPDGSRRSRAPDLGGRITQRVFEAVAAHLGIAATHGLDPCQMALAWLRTRPFTVFPIIGATDTDQLKLALTSVEVALPPEVLDEIALAHRAFPLPY